MDADLAALPNDIDALKAALAIERARMQEVLAERDVGAAELAVARAKASEDVALIAHQKLRIAKLERQLYGPRSERSERLIDQLALQFEELAASATEDELAAEIAVAKITNVAGFSRKFLPPTLLACAPGAGICNQRRSDERTRSGIVPPGNPNGNAWGGLRVLQQR